MNFEWDAGKNRSNIWKHGFDLADAAEMFQGALLVLPDTREEYGRVEHDPAPNCRSCFC